VNGEFWGDATTARDLGWNVVTVRKTGINEQPSPGSRPAGFNQPKWSWSQG